MRQLHEKINSRENFVPVLSVNRPWDFFMEKFHLSDPQHGVDDLNNYEAVLLEINGSHFLLLRYQGYPDDVVDVFVPRALESSEFPSIIVRELGVPRHAVTHHHR